MKILFIHRYKKIMTGAHFVNHFMARKAKERGITTQNIYSEQFMSNLPLPLKSMKDILISYPIMDQPKELAKFDFIQGSTYLPAAFFGLTANTICHFGSTYNGFLEAFKRTKKDFEQNGAFWKKLKQDGVVERLNFQVEKRRKDIAKLEIFAAEQAKGVIATSKKVRNELIQAGISEKKITIIYNALPNYWFGDIAKNLHAPKLVFLGRIGDDLLPWSLKGIDRLFEIYKNYPNLKKVSIIKTANLNIANWLKKNIENQSLVSNQSPIKIQKRLHLLRGSIVLLTSRYEGFSLSLVEAMSQGLIPVTFPVGIATEIINGKNGFIVQNVKEANQKIDLLLKNEKLRQDMSQAAYETALNFKEEIFADKLMSLYEKLSKKSLLRASVMAQTKIIRAVI